MTANCFNFEKSYLQLPSEFYTLAFPVPVSSPEMVIMNHPLADSLGVDLMALSYAQQAQLLSGNQIMSDSTPFCQAYAGHQYAHFTLLGDGRAHVLGEHITPNGSRVDIQLKGSGQTPYSRNGDGRAALGPMLREYIISEAMHSLGIPTTRSLAVLSTGDRVMRETAQPGGILARVARSHIRVGTFEHAALQRDSKHSQSLLEYTVNRHFPELHSMPNLALAFLTHVVKTQAQLITHWMRVGFIHGVMNTDNVSIAGETIDYGPCAFMDEYDPNTVFSFIDKPGRYAFANQPDITQWNIARLAESLLPLIDKDQNLAVDMASDVVSEFSNIYKNKWLSMMRSKLGLAAEQKDDITLITDLLTWMQEHSVDYTNTFLYLTYDDNKAGKAYENDGFKHWHNRWQKRLGEEESSPAERTLLMKKNNPVIIPRNHWVEKALVSATSGDLTTMNLLLNALEHPYENSNDIDEFKQPPKPCERIKNTFCGT
jgi:serine/tyrosine/threonine adenylyltransferase